MARRTSTKAIEVNTDIELDNEPEETTDNRKYMSHNGHGHAQKGEAGKKARAACRRAHRAWFAAEAEFLASQEKEAVAV
jgi:hypothetical protein